MSYTKEERETILRTDDCMENWIVFTRQRKIMTKLLKLPEFEEKRREYGTNNNIIELEGVIPFKSLSFRKLRKLSEEMRQEMSERLKRAREAKE